MNMAKMKVTAINLPETISVALLVIGGEFGNGEERKKKLKENGYNYNEVQECVNMLVPILNKYGGDLHG